MELIVAAALILVIVAWCCVRSKTRANQVVAGQQTTYSSLPTPALSTDLPTENTLPIELTSTLKLQQTRRYAEIVDPRGGVRDISSNEVEAYFEPYRKRIASLRKVAANSGRTAQAFRQNGGAAPDVGMYRRAHNDAVDLSAEIERLLDLILFEAESSSIKYYDFFESVIDVELKLDESLMEIAAITAEITSGHFSANGSLRAKRH